LAASLAGRVAVERKLPFSVDALQIWQEAVREVQGGRRVGKEFATTLAPGSAGA
jgi:hypothetical protein